MNAHAVCAARRHFDRNSPAPKEVNVLSVAHTVEGISDIHCILARTASLIFVTCMAKRLSAITSFNAVSGTTLHNAAVTKKVMWSVFSRQKPLS